MNAIPEEFQIKTLLNQDTYLVDGELKNGKVKHQRFSTISSKDQRICGIYSIYGRKKKAWRQLMPMTRLITVRAYGL
jgi:hypothetical protein